MSNAFEFPALAACNINIPTTPLLKSAYDYVKNNTSSTTVNHCLRSVAFAMLLKRKMSLDSADEELVVHAVLLHDLGWATTPGMLSADKRFEVDGAELAREFLRMHAEPSEWDKHRLQVLWDVIALHTTPSIARYKEPEVCLASLGITADFVGPNFPGGLITVEEYKEIVATFPRDGFKEGLIEVMCGLCRDKKATTFDNFVGEFGKTYGTDGKGGGKEEYAKEREENSTMKRLLGGLDAAAKHE